MWLRVEGNHKQVRGMKKAGEERTKMGEERRFPCPYCGFEFHYTPDEPRLSAPCLKCGKKLTMPHGRFDKGHKRVFGLASGAFTGEEQDTSDGEISIWAIRRWEEVRAKLNPSRDECRTAELELYWALWWFPPRPFVLDGKRYIGIFSDEGLSVALHQHRRRSGKGDRREVSMDDEKIREAVMINSASPASSRQFGPTCPRS